MNKRQEYESITKSYRGADPLTRRCGPAVKTVDLYPSVWPMIVTACVGFAIAAAMVVSI